VPRRLPDQPILVDASFVLGVLFGERAAVRFTSVLSRSSIVDVNLGEVFYKVDQRMPTPPLDVARALAAQGVRVVELGISGVAHFPMLKKLDGRGRGSRRSKGSGSVARSLSLADMACLSVAIERDLPVLTGDAHWLTLALPVRIEMYRDPALVP
jgi:PIN domain nuclease of toxin-antitoxin system